MKPPALDSFDRYDAQLGRRYLALETDSPERWLTFAVNHPKFKASDTRIWVHLEHGFGQAVIWGRNSGND